MIRPFSGIYPHIDSRAFIFPSALVVGDVSIGAESSLWFNTVVRGDVHYIKIGERTNIQDNCVVHVTRKRFSTTIGDEVTIGHSATIHGCTIHDNCLIGIGAIVLDGAEVGPECMVAAGALITPGVKIPPRTLVLGSPAKPKRTLNDEEIDRLHSLPAHYVEYFKQYQSEGWESLTLDE